MQSRNRNKLASHTLLCALLAGAGFMAAMQPAHAQVTIGGKDVLVENGKVKIPLVGTIVWPGINSGGVLNAGGGITTTALGVTGAVTVNGTTTTNGITNIGNIANDGNVTVTGDTKTKTLQVTGASTTHGITNIGDIANDGNVTVTGDTKTKTLQVTGASTTNGITNTGNFVNTGDTKTQTLQVTGASMMNGIDNNGQRIQNVGAAVAGTDAVNLNQLNERFGEAQKYTDNGIAAALAIPSMPTLAPGKGWAGVAVGNYGSATAVGLAAGYQVNERWNLGLGVSQATRSGGKTAVKAQAGFSW